MPFYQIIQGLSVLSDEELRQLKDAIGREAAARDHRTIVDQLNLTEQQEGQNDFENELIRARGKARGENGAAAGTRSTW